MSTSNGNETPTMQTVDEFRQSFREAWDTRTVYFDPDNYTGELTVEVDLATGKAVWPDFERDYRGVDYSQTNQWSVDLEDGTIEFWYGAEYRKDVSPTDDLGSYQAAAFTITDKGYFEIVEDKGHWIINHKVGEFTSHGQWIDVFNDRPAYWLESTHRVPVLGEDGEQLMVDGHYQFEDQPYPSTYNVIDFIHGGRKPTKLFLSGAEMAESFYHEMALMC